MEKITEKVSNFEKTYKKIKVWFLALNIVPRTIIQSLIGAFAGASVIHFFNTYALYFHAYYQGFRVPVEGVEYLDLAISLVSFIFILISLGSSIILYFILKRISTFFYNDWIRRVGDDKSSQRLNKIFGKLQFIILIGLNIFIIWNGVLTEAIPYIIIINFILVILFLGMHFIQKDSSIKTIVLVITLVAIIAFTISLFYQPFYKKFLERIQYGGEISIEIEYRKADNTESNIKGLLLMRTNKGIILKDSISEDQFEIPIERVSKITFLKSELNVK
jgi:hypothetical protein